MNPGRVSENLTAYFETTVVMFEGTNVFKKCCKRHSDTRANLIAHMEKDHKVRDRNLSLERALQV